MNAIYYQNSFEKLNGYISQKNPSKIFILVDENTHEYCLPKVLPEIETNAEIEILEIESGEENKNIETCIQLWASLLDLKADRKSLLINVGGGVITDMGGFLASTYMRGISFVNIPTTLLSMADASVGGKTGVDFEQSKNIIGTFALPEMVLIQPVFLETLPYNQLRSGFAEMLKHGLISDKEHWKDLTRIKDLTVEDVSPFIESTINIKKRVVEIDFKEENLRKTLNFGHTIGHGIESYFLSSSEPLLHGEAIVLGMKYELEIAVNKQLISKELKDEILAEFKKYYPDILRIEVDYNDILPFMLKDKKNENQAINMSLISEIGKCEYNCFCSLDEVKIVL